MTTATADTSKVIASVEWATSLPSAANLRENHFARHRRVKAQRLTALQMLLANAGRPPVLGHGSLVHVTLTRIAPRMLDDHDNLRMAFKAQVDSVAQWLGLRSDRDPRIAFSFAQEKSRFASIRIEITRVA